MGTTTEAIHLSVGAATFLTKQEMLTSHNKPVMLNFTHTGAAACCYIE